MKAFEDVLAERKRQAEQEGFTQAHDDSHHPGELAAAAACYALNASSDHGIGHSLLSRHWPWRREWWKPTNKRRDLVKAAALIIAEIEKIDRAGN